jgi:sulfur carrier protein ThiS
MDTPQRVLGEFTERHGYNRRVAVDGNPIMYGLVREFDESSEAFTERWSVLSTGDDTYSCIDESFQGLMTRVQESVEKFAPTHEQFTLVRAVALVTYGKAREVDSADKVGIVDDPAELSRLRLDPTEELDHNARLILLICDSGFAIESVITAPDGSVVDRSSREHIISEDSEIEFHGHLHLVMVRGFMLLLLMSECAIDRGNLKPTTLVRYAVEVGFPFREHIIKSLLHAIVESVNTTDAFAESVCSMLDLDDDNDDE